MSKWFLFANDVTGPFSTEEVQSQIGEDSISSSALIWGFPMAEWRSPAWWLKNLTQLSSDQIAKKNPLNWHYALGKESFGPITKTELLKKISTINDKSQLMLWTKGMNDWAPFFEFYDIMDTLGFSQRTYKRADISGDVVIRKNNVETIIGKLHSVSAGGFGARQITNLKAGDEVNIELKSPGLNQPVRALATVQYVSSDHYAGFRFHKIHIEAQSAVVAYIKAQSIKKAA